MIALTLWLTAGQSEDQWSVSLWGMHLQSALPPFNNFMKIIYTD